jgi:hypothetical protein
LTTYTQLFINGDLYIQNGATLYADDTIQLAAASSIATNGILQSTKSINTNGYLINTGTSGFIISPVASGIAKVFDIGTTSSNKIQLQHSTGSSVIFQLAVRDSVYTNPISNVSLITTNVVNKRWYVTPQSSVSSLSGIAYWNASDESSGFLRSNCGVSYWQSGASTAWSFTNGTAAATVTGSSPSYSKTTTAAGLTAGVYYFGVGGYGSSLPVSILTFNANINNNDVYLKWATSTEINNAFFEIERSSNGINFTKIDRVKGAGNSNTKIDYLEIDLNPFTILITSKLYYRLKQVDFDGNFVYTDIKEVDLQKNNFKKSTTLNIKMYPNPNNSLLNIDVENLQAQKVYIKIIDANGNVILRDNFQITSDKHALQVNTSQYSAGVYLLSITDESGTIINQQKLIIY